jgi:pyrroline-5-carboxylate reductase
VRTTVRKQSCGRYSGAPVRLPARFCFQKLSLLSMTLRMKLGVIGCGKMATALVEGVLQAGLFAPEEIGVSDVHPGAVEALCNRTKVNALRSNAEVAAEAETLLLCVKPGDAAEALAGLRGGAAGRLIISIMAGVTLEKLGALAGPNARLARVMPNTPALIHKAASAYALGSTCTNDDAATVEKIFAAVGTVARVKEPLLDAVTGLSGSGPAYVYLVVEALSDAGVLVGLPRELSLQLAAQTVAGAAEMVLRSGQHPAQLRDMVTSPGGTTIAGLHALEDGAVRAAFLAAVQAATERSRELGAQ